MNGQAKKEALIAEQWNLLRYLSKKPSYRAKSSPEPDKLLDSLPSKL
jgi:hypothetical protein